MPLDHRRNRPSAVRPTLEVLEERALPSAAPLDFGAVNAQTWTNRLFLLEVGPVAVANADLPGWKDLLRADTTAAYQEGQGHLTELQAFLQDISAQRDQELASLKKQADAGDTAAASAIAPVSWSFAQSLAAVQALTAQVAYNQALTGVDLAFVATLPDVADAPVVPDLSPSLLQHLRAIVARGREQGNRSDWFIKVGDSITATGEFLAPLGSPGYDPKDPAVVGPYANLAATVNYFRHPSDASARDASTKDASAAVDPFTGEATGTDTANSANSFTRTSTAATPGWTTNQVLTALPGEIAQVKPAVALIMIGTNDLYAFRDAAQFRAHLTAIVNEAIDAGVIPVLSTIPDHLYVPGGAAIFNQVIAEVATATNVPLMNYWRALQTLPNKGISGDLIHPTADPQGTGLFTAQGLQYGFNVRNLVALQTLDLLRREVLT